MGGKLRDPVRGEMLMKWIKTISARLQRWQQAREAKRRFEAAKKQIEYHAGLTLNAETRRQAMNGKEPQSYFKRRGDRY
jgi:hypothetical protein